MLKFKRKSKGGGRLSLSPQPLPQRALNPDLVISSIPAEAKDNDDRLSLVPPAIPQPDNRLSRTKKKPAISVMRSLPERALAPSTTEFKDAWLAPSGPSVEPETVPIPLPKPMSSTRLSPSLYGRSSSSRSQSRDWDDEPDEMSEPAGRSSSWHQQQRDQLAMGDFSGTSTFVHNPAQAQKAESVHVTHLRTELSEVYSDSSEATPSRGSRSPAVTNRRVQPTHSPSIRPTTHSSSRSSRDRDRDPDRGTLEELTNSWSTDEFSSMDLVLEPAHRVQPGSKQTIFKKNRHNSGPALSLSQDLSLELENEINGLNSTASSKNYSSSAASAAGNGSNRSSPITTRTDASTASESKHTHSHSSSLGTGSTTSTGRSGLRPSLASSKLPRSSAGHSQADQTLALPKR